MRKTRIVCTLGPASNTAPVIRQMMEAGMNVARFNFSHGTHASHLAMLQELDRVRNDMGEPVAALMDTRGPEVRLGTFAEGRVMLNVGDRFTLTGRPVQGDANIVSITYPELAHDLGDHTRILIDDGNIELRVEDVDGQDIHTRVVSGGPLSDRKGVNIPGVRLGLPYIDQRDEDDLLFGIRTGFDYVAASFVRSAEDLLQMRTLLDRNGGQHIRLIAKIENAEGVANIGEIIQHSDGIMVARGDLGVEVPLEEIPVLQKQIIRLGSMAGRPVITATQMLESMGTHPRPTRAEITDVANAIYDGTSATMLSGETANGKYPVEAVRTMARIAERTEQDINYAKRFVEHTLTGAQESITNAISHATCLIAYRLNATAIISVTKSGTTARMISRFRPSMPIVACTPEAVTRRQLSLSWGVTPLIMPEERVTDVLFQQAVYVARNAKLVAPGDTVVLTAGVPLAKTGNTNLIKVVQVPEN
ncbi:MAG: pyruvate kinase [Clostridiales bacterium]|nr:pyruvate kinase [Clostridiales bacterium]